MAYSDNDAEQASPHLIKELSSDNPKAKSRPLRGVEGGMDGGQDSVIPCLKHAAIRVGSHGELRKARKPASFKSVVKAAIEREGGVDTKVARKAQSECQSSVASQCEEA